MTHGLPSWLTTLQAMVRGKNLEHKGSRALERIKGRRTEKTKCD